MRSGDTSRNEAEPSWPRASATPRQLCRHVRLPERERVRLGAGLEEGDLQPAEVWGHFRKSECPRTPRRAHRPGVRARGDAVPPPRTGPLPRAAPRPRVGLTTTRRRTSSTSTSATCGASSARTSSRACGGWGTAWAGIWADGRGGSERVLGLATGGGPDLPGLGESRVPVGRLDPEAAVAWLRDLIARTCEGPPSMLIWGRADRLMRFQIAEKASRQFGWPLYPINDNGHGPHIERPDASSRRSRAPSHTHDDRRVDARALKRQGCLGGWCLLLVAIRVGVSAGTPHACARSGRQRRA
jgi:hypothetical protein